MKCSKSNCQSGFLILSEIEGHESTCCQGDDKPVEKANVAGEDEAEDDDDPDYELPAYYRRRLQI